MRAILNTAYSLFLSTSLLLPQFAQAKSEAPAAIVEKELGGQILEAKPSALEKAIAASIREDRKDSDKFAPAVLKSGRADANAIAPFLVVASIQALGKEIKESELTSLIYASVKATPDAVLEIVAAASREVPQNMVEAIASAAINAVPDPYKMVEYRKNLSTGHKFAANKDFKGSYKDTPEPGMAETLSEAIIDTAADASGIDRSVLVAAANNIMGSIHSPSALGVAGDPNYGNEPRIEAPTIPVVSK